MILHWLIHFIGADYGAPYGRWVPESFWSGFGSDIGEVAIIGGILAIVRRHNCHVKGCWRVGRHPVEGTAFVVCRAHHPDGKPTHRDVLDAHRRSVRPQSGGKRSRAGV